MCNYYGSERGKLHFRESSFEKFPRGTCPRNPLEVSASLPAEPLYPYFQMLPKTLFGDLKLVVPRAVPPRLSGHFFIFWLVFFVLRSLLWTARQWCREQFAILTLKPYSHVRILIYRTWGIPKRDDFLCSVWLPLIPRWPWHGVPVNCLWANIITGQHL